MSSTSPSAKIFAIGDIHGCAAELRALLELLPIDSSSTVVFLGDYIDRGPHSREVVDTIIELRARCKVVALRGNHEAMLLEFLDGSDPRRVARFIYNGGSSTLAAYADERGHYVFPEEHLRFYNELPLFFDDGAHFFVHAGVPDVPLDEIDLELHADELVWLRKEFIQSSFQWDRCIVHGHTPVASVDFTKRRINIDTGCVYGRELTAMEFPSYRVYHVPKMVEAPVYLRDKTSRRAAVRFAGHITVHISLGGRLLAFKTIDYSEIGMSLRLAETPHELIFEVGDRVTGTIGEGEGIDVPFVGEVARIAQDHRGQLYGVRILQKGTP